MTEKKAKEKLTFDKPLSPEGEARLLAAYRIIARIALRRLQREKAEAAAREQAEKDDQRPAD